jgi:hypothetical protein
MLLPILDAEDGYGLTYGARVSYVGVTGRRGRVSVPLTWGGQKRAAAEFDRPFTSGPLTRVQVGAGIQRIHNPGFDLDDTRRRAWVRAERVVGPVRMGGTAEWQRVSFGGADDDVRSGGVDVTLDTRRDPQLPRNAVLASAGWTRLSFQSGGDLDRTKLEGRGYLGLVGQSVLVVRALREDASRPLPQPSSRCSADRRIFADSGPGSRPATRWSPGRSSSESRCPRPSASVVLA